jgi:hypothetical protein
MTGRKTRHARRPLVILTLAPWEGVDGQWSSRAEEGATQERGERADEELGAALSSCMLFSSTWVIDMTLRMQSRFWGCARVVCSAMIIARLASISRAELTLRIADYATAPMSGAVTNPPAWANNGYLARINFMAEEPGGGDRFFVNDLNGKLYTLDKQTKTFTQYLDFNGRDERDGDGNLLFTRPGMFEEFVFKSGFANGFITFQFDPDYSSNGKFYTVHMEEPGVISGSNNDPKNTVAYPTSTSVNAPGSTNRHTVLVEWNDTNIANNTFEGTARELLRMDLQGQIHPMGDIIFNPNAGPGDPDWRVMYVAIGDGGAGEGGSSVEKTPQQLDALGGKILRVIPDQALHTATSTLSPNGRYRIPNDNPFRSINDSAVRDEIYALGLRNPHRISWDAETDTIIVNDIGLHTWEEVNIIHAGANYGYSTREGNQALSPSTEIGPLPSPDEIPVQIDFDTTSGVVTPIYPVVQYGHGLAGQTGPEGDSITSGYVYRGSNIPSLQGKYIYGDITTGQLFWSDFAEMLAADDGNPNTMAAIHQIDVAWDNPATAGGETVYTLDASAGAVRGPMYHVVRAAYDARGGQDTGLPGSAAVTGSFGRADIRIQVDEAGELYILSKSDGMIRYIVEAVGDADFNGDDLADGADFLIWQRNLGSAGGLAQGDADGDGKVTGADLGFWQQQFEEAPPLAAVPEPATGILGLAGLSTLLRRRKCR